MPDAALEEAFAPFVGQAFGPPEVARDPVNEAMVRQWCDAMGDRNPIHWEPGSTPRHKRTHEVQRVCRC